MSISVTKQSLSYEVDGVGGHHISLPNVFLANAKGRVDEAVLEGAFERAVKVADYEDSNQLDRWQFDQVCARVYCDLGIWGRAQEQEPVLVLAS